MIAFLLKNAYKEKVLNNFSLEFCKSLRRHHLLEFLPLKRKRRWFSNILLRYKGKTALPLLEQDLCIEELDFVGIGAHYVRYKGLASSFEYNVCYFLFKFKN